MTATLDLDANHDHVPGSAEIADEHDHSWSTASAHRTSEGTVTYESCGCGAHRVLCAGHLVARVRLDAADADGDQVRSRLT